MHPKEIFLRCVYLVSHVHYTFYYDRLGHLRQVRLLEFMAYFGFLFIRRSSSDRYIMASQQGYITDS